MAIGVERHHRGRPGRPVPRRQHLHRGAAPRRRGPRRRVRRAVCAAGRPSPGRSAGRSPGPGAGPSLIRPTERARRAWPGRTATACAAVISTPGRMQPLPGVLGRGVASTSASYRAPVQLSQRPQRSPSRKLRVVELAAQEHHPAFRRCPGSRAWPAAPACAPRRAVRYRSLVVGPLLAGADPAALDAPDRAVDVEHLQHHLQPGAARSTSGSSAGGRLRRSPSRARITLRTSDSDGNATEAKYAPDVAVLRAGQQDHLGAVGGPARAADLLVVRDRRGRRAEVDDEAEVGLVEAHAECRRGDECLDPVGQQVGLELLTFGGLGGAGVGGHRVAPLAQQRRDVMGLRDGERVDDARTGQRHPDVRRARPRRCAGLPACTTDSRSDSRSSPPRSTRVSRPPTPSWLATSSTTRSLAVAVVASTGMSGRQFGDQRADAPVVGPEVVAPVRHAVRLVDDHQAGVGGQRGQHLVAEVRIVQPFRADQQHVEIAARTRRGSRPSRRRWPS